MKRAIREWIGPCLLIPIIAGGCAGGRDEWPETPPPPQPVTILETGPTAGDAQRAAGEAILAGAFPDALRLRAEQLVTAGPGLRQSGAVLVVPAPHALSQAHWQALTNHVARGGLALLWGRLAESEEGLVEADALPEPHAFPFSARVVCGLPAGRVQAAKPIPLQGSFPGPRQSPDPHGYRWIPLAVAQDSDRTIRGWPAALHVHAPTGGPLRAWGWIGWDPDKSAARAQRSLLRQAATRLQRRQFLLQGGLDRHALQGGEPLAIRAAWASALPATGPWRVVAEIEDPGGRVTRRHAEVIAASRPARQFSSSFSLGTSARRPDADEHLLLRIGLSDAGGAAPFDELTQPIRVMAERTAGNVARDDAPGIRGVGFTRGRRPLVPIGARFGPIVITGASNPLSPGRYDPVLVERELALHEEAGFNLTAVTFTDPDQAPQLRMLLEEFRARQIRVLLEIPALSPWARDTARATGLLRALRLAPDDPVFAISTGLVTPPADADEEAVFQAAWARWVAGQYGSPVHAAAQLGCPPEAVTADSAWRAPSNLPDPARFAVRRFLADEAGRHFGACRRALAREGWTGFFTAGSGGALDPAAGAHQLDFVTLDAGALDPSNPARLAFHTAYARAVSGGKPVLWTGLAVPMPYPPAPAALSGQAGTIDRAMAALLRSQAAGVILGDLAGGPRGGADLDNGLVHPSGAWRESGQRAREQAQAWRREKIRPVPWRGREIEPGALAGGVDAAWDAWRERFCAEYAAGQIEELRPAGWGRLSAELPPAALGGGPRNEPAPLHYLNAEWTPLADTTPGAPARVRQREPVRLELINTGIATWSPSITGHVGGVWIRVTQHGGRGELLPLRETQPGARAHLLWTPADPGRCTLRPWLHPAGAFGQPFEIDVE